MAALGLLLAFFLFVSGKLIRYADIGLVYVFGHDTRLSKHASFVLFFP